MARAINDIALVRQGHRRHSTYDHRFYAITAVVGLSFMYALSPALTLMLLLPMPIVALVGTELQQSNLRTIATGARRIWPSSRPSSKKI